MLSGTITEISGDSLFRKGNMVNKKECGVIQKSFVSYCCIEVYQTHEIYTMQLRLRKSYKCSMIEKVFMIR